ncbi:MAG: NAD(P)-binding protein [Lachnospiraceae bacterium]|nr:NAD(P)-binding protein [Lachnospiraceae bacterium]
MIRLPQIHVSVVHEKEDIIQAAAKELRIAAKDIQDVVILKKSVDARKKDDIHYSYSLAVSVPQEERYRKKGYEQYIPKKYRYTVTGTKTMHFRPVVAGAGPAGLFAAYLLAKEGYRPLVIERGPSMEERIEAVERFFQEGVLDPEANIQFGEGGAGTFSDGKLNTLVKDRDGKGHFILEKFVECGAPEEILYLNKPHIGTDKLRNVIVNLREEIIRLGGTFRFRTCLKKVVTSEGKLTGIVLSDGTEINTDVLVLAIGHSSRDTIAELFGQGIRMEPKSYAMGVRIQHPRTFIDRNQYGDYADLLPAADYKLTYTAKDGRGIYSFCMCPGGYVVNASSEPGRLCVNGMSDHARDAANSNAAIVITVDPDDYKTATGSDSPLCGMAFQRDLEERAYKAGNGFIPTQRFGDFEKRIPSTGCGAIEPCTKGRVTYTDLNEVLPEQFRSDLIEGIHAFDRMIPGFADADALLCAIEARTSSPVRIPRDETYQSVSLPGLYPCGEGAGYAGGIMSAAMDGIRVFEAIIQEYKAVTE